MKVFIVFFYVFLAANGNPLESKRNDRLKSVARTYLNRTAVMTSSIKDLREAIDNTPEKSKEKIISLIESEVSKYPKMIEIQKETNMRSAMRGFAHCRKFFKIQMQISKESLEEKLTNAVKTQLRMNEITLDNTEKFFPQRSEGVKCRVKLNHLSQKYPKTAKICKSHLFVTKRTNVASVINAVQKRTTLVTDRRDLTDITKIANNLQGRNLDNELELCQTKNIDECNLTGKYKTVINHSELVISNIQNITKLVVELAYKTKITEKGLSTESKNISNYLSRIGCIENPDDIEHENQLYIE
ncbi:hypothetical protein TSAR_002531 [Trichomalopsis sarcophagae]|uniref:Protein TsetseEP domain-containing protein n=1 Tax=Trichomalopsis sarcophagae TaxID=543379 RepID=A0A232FLE3_9HYME|nr:hypothetical protein TSAR_002531 [Trichomalopsis sarcophagae]